MPETQSSAVSTAHQSPPENAGSNIYFVTHIFTPPLYQVYRVNYRLKPTHVLLNSDKYLNFTRETSMKPNHTQSCKIKTIFN